MMVIMFFLHEGKLRHWVIKQYLLSSARVGAKSDIFIKLFKIKSFQSSTRQGSIDTEVLGYVDPEPMIQIIILLVSSLPAHLQIV